MTTQEIEMLQEIIRLHNDSTQKAERSFAELHAELNKLRHEVRDGFASMRTQLADIHQTVALHERRVTDAEFAIDRIDQALGINQDDDPKS